MLSMAAVRTNPEAEDPGDEQAQVHRGQGQSHSQSSKDTVAKENCSERQIEIQLRHPSHAAVFERQRHRLVHLPFRKWCTFSVIGRGREETHRKRERRDHDTASLAGLAGGAHASK